MKLPIFVKLNVLEYLSYNRKVNVVAYINFAEVDYFGERDGEEDYNIVQFSDRQKSAMLVRESPKEIAELVAKAIEELPR